MNFLGIPWQITWCKIYQINTFNFFVSYSLIWYLNFEKLFFLFSAIYQNTLRSKPSYNIQVKPLYLNKNIQIKFKYKIQVKSLHWFMFSFMNHLLIIYGCLYTDFCFVYDSFSPDSLAVFLIIGNTLMKFTFLVFIFCSEIRFDV